MSNIQRWVQRVDGVKNVKTNLNTGQAAVWFESGKEPQMSDLWEAVKSTGYEPSKIESAGRVYEGPKP